MRIVVVTTSYPRHAGDVAGRFVADAVERLRALVAPGDAVLVKASRAAGRDAVADALVGVPA